jgi:hypothetical protein
MSNIHQDREVDVQVNIVQSAVVSWGDVVVVQQVIKGGAIDSRDDFNLNQHTTPSNDPSMTVPTRDEFLNYVHRGLTHSNTDPKKSSPTKSTQRYRWRQLLPWDVEAEARGYWDALGEDQKTAALAVMPGYWDFVQVQLDGYTQPLTSESRLRIPFGNAFQIPHNLAIRGAGDAHAEMWTEGAQPDPQPLANADLIMVYDGKLCGLVELKTWWKVTEAEIEEVRQGTKLTDWVFLTEGYEPLEGEHHGRLALEQTYGYMCFDKVRYGIMAIFNAFVFMKRQTGGILHMSRTIPITSTTPTILKLLYFFSHLCALHPEPYPEVNSEGIAIHLKSAPKTPDKAPKIPDPHYRPSSRAGTLPPPKFEQGTRRSPRFMESSSAMETLRLDVGKLTSLGCKGWRGTLTNGQSVFAKLWDGWKFSTSDSEHEADVYYRLRDLWANIVPDFIGFGHWGFCHILLLSILEVSSLLLWFVNVLVSYVA